MHPAVWLHNENVSWRIGSTSKMAMMLAAVQLRLEVRQIMGLNIISTPKEFDDLYGLTKLWKGSKVANASQIASQPPRVSTIFDFSKKPINFTGPDPDTPDRDGILGGYPLTTSFPGTRRPTSFSRSATGFRAPCRITSRQRLASARSGFPT